MARVQKADRGLNSRLDEFEKRVFLLKISYEKYFAGVDPVEPIRDRDDVRRLLRDLLQSPTHNSAQRFRLQQMKARMGTLELYWARNVYQIERGIHPKQRFRADLKERLRAEAEARARAAGPAGPSRTPRQEREEAGYRAVFDKYVELRGSCGQSTDIDFNTVRDTLKKQVEALKARTQCTSVKFKVVVEDGKARVKAVPLHA